MLRLLVAITCFLLSSALSGQAMVLKSTSYDFLIHKEGENDFHIWKHKEGLCLFAIDINTRAFTSICNIDAIKVHNYSILNAEVDLEHTTTGTVTIKLEDNLEGSLHTIDLHFKNKKIIELEFFVTPRVKMKHSKIAYDDAF